MITCNSVSIANAVTKKSLGISVKDTDLSKSQRSEFADRKTS